MLLICCPAASFPTNNLTLNSRNSQHSSVSCINTGLILPQTLYNEPKRRLRKTHIGTFYFSHDWVNLKYRITWDEMKAAHYRSTKILNTPDIPGYEVISQEVRGKDSYCTHRVQWTMNKSTIQRNQQQDISRVVDNISMTLTSIKLHVISLPVPLRFILSHRLAGDGAACY